MGEDLKTIKELADELGIEKKKVSYQVTKLDSSLVTKLDGKIHLSDVAISMIKANLGILDNGEFTDQSDSELDTFSQYLVAEKEIQIELLSNENEFLKKQVSELNTLLDQQQQLQLKTQQILEEKTLMLETAKKKKWYQFWK